MAAGTLFVGWAPWRWGPAAGPLRGLLFAGGALTSPTGLMNLPGEASQRSRSVREIEIVGALTALIATSTGYRIHADAS